MNDLNQGRQKGHGAEEGIIEDNTVNAANDDSTRHWFHQGDSHPVGMAFETPLSVPAWEEVLALID